MSNILISVATLIIGFILVTYGAYSGHHGVLRTKYTMITSNALERIIVYAQATREDLGRVPLSTEIPATRLSFENRDGVVFSYNHTGTHGAICARAERQSYIEEAFQNVRDQRPGALYGGDCDTNTGPSATHVSVTVRML